MVTLNASKNTLPASRFTWLKYQLPPRFILPQPWRSWVLDKGSLTKRLIQASDKTFRVRLISNHYQTPSYDEALRLDISRRTSCLIREVELICHEQVWVTARSVIPVTTLTGEERILAHLGEKPLGGFLFSAKTMRRTAFEVGHRTTGCQGKHSQANQSYSQHWARRSVFFLHDKPLLVSECFEPALFGKAS